MNNKAAAVNKDYTAALFWEGWNTQEFVDCHCNKIIIVIHVYTCFRMKMLLSLSGNIYTDLSKNPIYLNLQLLILIMFDSFVNKLFQSIMNKIFKAVFTIEYQV